MITYNPADLSVPAVQNLLQSSIGPRPIAWASTINSEGAVNLSPFSFFNVFSANPPVLVFSPALRVRDTTSKHTLDNVKDIPEVVIHIVNYALVQQMSLSSSEYPLGVNEFIKAGLTQIPSECVKPPRIKESPVQFECVVDQIIALGNEGGAGNLVVCTVKRIHVSEQILNDKGFIDMNKIDLVSRMGGNWYCRASGDALFEVEKPLSTLGMGVDQLPDFIRLSPVLTGNHLGQLGNTEHLPDAQWVKEFKDSDEFELLKQHAQNTDFAAHRIAANLLDSGEVLKAWLVLLAER